MILTAKEANFPTVHKYHLWCNGLQSRLSDYDWIQFLLDAQYLKSCAKFALCFFFLPFLGVRGAFLEQCNCKHANLIMTIDREFYYH